jgi:transcriptional regulator with XRE-family HTH domain
MDFDTLQRRLLAGVRALVQNGELTERGFARMIGISQPHMHHILKGVRALSLDNADRILRCLDLTVLDLIEGDTFPLHISGMRSHIAGREQDEEGALASIGAEGWERPGENVNPSAQPAEAF